MSSQTKAARERRQQARSAGELAILALRQKGFSVEPMNRGIAVSNRNERPIFSMEDEWDVSAPPRGRNYPRDDIDGYHT